MKIHPVGAEPSCSMWMESILPLPATNLHVMKFLQRNCP